jgi:hypothetical protein
MAGTWIMIKKGNKRYGTPFTFNEEEIDNIRYNSPKGEKYTFQNAISRRVKTVTGAGAGVSKQVLKDRIKYGKR